MEGVGGCQVVDEVERVKGMTRSGNKWPERIEEQQRQGRGGHVLSLTVNCDDPITH